ncbi:MAG: hypothetical protein ACI8Y4_002694 [Candidatus Poriferisodalaceae bacterium]|jgi:hypothetical protein
MFALSLVPGVHAEESDQLKVGMQVCMDQLKVGMQVCMDQLKVGMQRSSSSAISMRSRFS